MTWSALLGIVKDTMRPTHLSLWVCPPSWSPSKELQEPFFSPARTLQCEGEGSEDIAGSLLSFREILIGRGGQRQPHEAGAKGVWVGSASYTRTEHLLTLPRPPRRVMERARENGRTIH